MNVKKVYLEQHDSNDCGAACLAMILKFYGKDFTITKIRDVVGTDINGTPINGLHHGAERLGFAVKKIRIKKEVMAEQFTLPAICHVRTPEGASHFVVLYKVKNNKVLILDPAKGILKQSIDNFFKYFDGLILLMYPDVNFMKNDINSPSLFKNYMQLLKPQKRLFFYAILASLILTALGIFISLFDKVLMDEILPYKLKNLLVAYSIGFGIAIIIKVLLSVIRQHLIIYLSQRIDLPLMLGYFRHIFKLPINFFASRKIGDITTRFQDAFVIKNILTNSMLTIIIDITLAVVTAIIMLTMSWKLFLIILVITVLSAILIYCYKGLYKKLNKKQMEQAARLNGVIIENLKGIESVKANACEEPIMGKIENDYVKSLKLSFSENFHANIQSGFSQLITGIGNIILMAIGVYFVIQNEITLGTVLAFFTIAGYFLDPIGRLIELQLQIQEANISLKRLTEIKDIEEEEKEEESTEQLKNIKFDILIKDLTFRYGSRTPVLKNINMELPKGKKIAIIGESGSGKSTLAKLLLKFYRIENGEILYGGKSINNINAFSLRKNIGYVPQNIETFSGTIIDNVKIGNENSSREDIIYACEQSGCQSFIKRLPFGYDTFLDESGGGLSGGEKQRLVLARALVKKPYFIILDEATSNLDFGTEQEILDTLFKKDISLLIIAHRLYTIKNCDIIYVLKDGEIVEFGNHNQLLSHKTLYYKIWQKQSGEVYKGCDKEYVQSKETKKIIPKDGDIIEY